MAKTIPMIRESDGKTADVHPAEVGNFRAGGYVQLVVDDGDGKSDAAPAEEPKPTRGRPRKKRSD